MSGTRGVRLWAMSQRPLPTRCGRRAIIRRVGATELLTKIDIYRFLSYDLDAQTFPKGSNPALGVSRRAGDLALRLQSDQGDWRRRGHTLPSPRPLGPPRIA